ncbi:serine/threonine protein kinase [Phytophthora infestans T30-4]|uniref:non-specific serine/threonine protein kinase n=1 Tax=Phytophthora infestans (strain T30-4) TaxID=403677 RepID=D0NMI4_PHYIT|nr:serine/threonine protein kinase [Phytophthora infestans T30-4]EEY60905.1 serine/threonine protein kinase [Phytophthora infestans T30-4]|eukprot:XP_002899851.1 serine/threonine protein kinase [Phytophthora infestans T30-4]
MATARDRSTDRHARRSHRSRSRSPSASRSHRSSYRRSSKRRSASRSRSRERSRRSRHRHHSRRRHRSRSRSHSRERHKRRRRESGDKKVCRRSHSKSRSRSVPRAEKKAQNDQEPVTSSSTSFSRDFQAGKAAAAANESQVEKAKDVVEVDVSEAQKKEVQLTQTMSKVAVQERMNEGAAADKERLPNSIVSEESADKQEPAAAKPALDVSSIKADILKALADARSTIAVIKKSGASTSVATSPTPASAPVTAERDERKEIVESPLKQQQEVVQSPPKPSPSPQPTVNVADEFDMFSMAALDDHNDAMNGSTGVAAVTVDEVALQSNCDDAEGYYSTTIGEVLNGKYRVLGAVGKGVFSTVLRCQCVTPLETESGGSLSVVAVKLIRNNDVMRDAAQTELKLLKELGERDPRDKKHCIRLLDSFTHRSHVALVFEPMQMNVREAMKKFGGKGGISIQAVRVFSKHLLLALSHLEASGVIHADIKPDNMLLDEKQTTIKLCDFGSAFKADKGKQDPTPYLVSRFYRAPEVVLGLAYDKAVDMWSVGCCLYEMFTGRVMFPGSTNNEMLKFFMELKGKIPNKLIKKHRQAYLDQFEMEPHFTEDLKFCSRESDRVTGKPILRLMDTIKSKNDLAGSLMAAKSATDDRKQVLELRSLLDRMFTLDPSKRISVRDALAHPFVKSS